MISQKETIWMDQDNLEWFRKNKNTRNIKFYSFSKTKWSLLKKSHQQYWSSGYGWRRMFKRSWYRIPVPYIGWTFGHFFILICSKNCLKRPKINDKEAGVGPFKKNNIEFKKWNGLSLMKFYLAKTTTYLYLSTKVCSWVGLLNTNYATR